MSAAAAAAGGAVTGNGTAAVAAGVAAVTETPAAEALSASTGPSVAADPLDALGGALGGEFGVAHAWTVGLCALFVLVTPDEALVPVVIVGGLLVAGGLFFLALLASDRQAFESGPG